MPLWRIACTELPNTSHSPMGIQERACVHLKRFVYMLYASLRRKKDMSAQGLQGCWRWVLMSAGEGDEQWSWWRGCQWWWWWWWWRRLIDGLFSNWVSWQREQERRQGWGLRLAVMGAQLNSVSQNTQKINGSFSLSPSLSLCVSFFFPFPSSFENGDKNGNEKY